MVYGNEQKDLLILVSRGTDAEMTSQAVQEAQQYYFKPHDLEGLPKDIGTQQVLFKLTEYEGRMLSTVMTHMIAIRQTLYNQLGVDVDAKKV